jgi:hypothetical protein
MVHFLFSERVLFSLTLFTSWFWSRHTIFFADPTDLKATADGCTLLVQMISADGDTDLVQLLIQWKVDVMAVTHYYGTALHAAAT